MARILREDLDHVCHIAVSTPIAWLAPESAWPAVARALARTTRRILPGRQRALARRIPPFVCELTGRTPEEAAFARKARSSEQLFALLRCHRPGGWHPRIELAGREHLDEALSRGQGAILWVVSSFNSDLVSKMALYEAGYGVSHLSRPGHNFSNSGFARRLLNPITTRAENRYLRERIVINNRDQMPGLRRMRRRLGENGIVSITVTDQAVKTRLAPFFGGVLRVATGPVTLAQATGAALLPLLTRRRADGSFEVRIAPALQLGEGRGDAEPVLALASLVELHVREDAESWRGWGAWFASVDAKLPGWSRMRRAARAARS